MTTPSETEKNYKGTSVANENLGLSNTSATTHSDMLNIGKILLIIAGLDGELSDAELQYYLGYARGMNAPEEMIREWETFDWKNSNLDEYIAKLGSFKNPRRRRMLYTAIKISWADGYAEKERIATKKAGECFGIDPMTVTAIEAVVDMEKALADARYRLLGEIEETVPDQEGPVYQVTSQNKELLGESYISDKDLRNFGKILLIVAGADGEIAEKEMEYLLGFGQGMGAPDEMVAEWENFDWQNGKMEDHIAQLSNFGKPRRNRLLYTAIKVAWADEDYVQEEQEATRKIGELLEIDPVNVTAIEGLVKIERAIAGVLHDIFTK